MDERFCHMRNKLTKILLSKKKANAYVDASVVTIILTTFFIVLIFAYMIWMLQINTSDNINLVVTTYCKKMETQGCLTTNDLNKMKAELNKYGVINILISGRGTNGIVQPYGAEIEISLNGDIDYVNNTEQNEIVKNTIIKMRKYFNNNTFGIIKNITCTKRGTSKV